MDLEQNLRSTSDEMLRTLEQLQRLESEKRAEEPGTQRFVRLANEIERLAAIVFSQTTVQQSLAQQTHAAKRAGEEMPPAIDEISATRDVSVILGEWRDAERMLAATGIDTAEHAKAAADVRRLRDEYHRAHQAQTEGVSAT
jgi:hypothetical protein